MENDVALDSVRNDLEKLLVLADPERKKVVLILTLMSSYFSVALFFAFSF